MSLTTAQFRFLQMIDDAGGTATVSGLSVRIGEYKAPMSSPIAFLNLVAKGALEGRDGMLHITELGRSLLRTN